MSAAQLAKHFKEIRPCNFLACIVFVCALMSVVVAAYPDHQQDPAQKPAPDAAAQPAQNNADADQPRKTVQQLTAELTRLKKRVAELEKANTVESLQDKLEKEQQRAEGLHAQLLGTMEKEAALQSRMDQLDEQLRPENIDRSAAGVGSLHPEDVRDALRRRLTSEKRRIQSQLDLLNQDHTRLQSSLADSDAAIQRLRLRIAEATHSRSGD
jgi:small-conductance mechanosensitive channel